MSFGRAPVDDSACILVDPSMAGAVRLSPSLR